MELELINGDRFGNWEQHMAIQEQETELLERLHSDLCLREKLLPVVEADLKPGFVIIYALGKNTYGCHCLRSKESGFQYLATNDIRGAARAGVYFTLPDDA